MPIILALPLAIYGTMRLLGSARTGVYHLAVTQIERTSQPRSFRFNMAVLAAATAAMWWYALAPILHGAIRVTVVR